MELDSVNFQRTELRQALEFLAAKAKERTNQALNVVLIDPNHDLESKPVTLSLSRVPWSEAMRYTCELTGTTWQKEGNVIAVGAPAAVKTLQRQRTKIATGPGSENNQRRLDQMKISHVAFKESSLEEVADYLRLMGRELTSKDPNALPFNVMIKENIAKPVATRKVSVDLAEIPMSELLHYVTGLVNCRYRIDARAVVIGESEDLARPPGGPVNPRGPIFAQLAAKRIQAIDIPAGTTVGEFLEAVRTLGGVNGISLTDDAVASSRLAMQDVTVLELIRYFNEASGTAFRLDRNAFVIADDPAVPKKPRPPESLTTSLPKGGDASGLGFDP
ncbi:MAG: hypothetical protein KDN19_09220 [Verrucomicrobiae bacterium]|nr:hypothetical protein [Verrucomicrobiae bacterium]